jgi:hypothetical protein
VFDAPVLISGRWTETVQKIQSPQGEDVTSRAFVRVDQHVEVGSHLALGDYTIQEDPYRLNDALEVIKFVSTPDLRNVGTARKAYV